MSDLTVLWREPRQLSSPRPSSWWQDGGECPVSVNFAFLSVIMPTYKFLITTAQIRTIERFVSKPSDLSLTLSAMRSERILLPLFFSPLKRIITLYVHNYFNIIQALPLSGVMVKAPRGCSIWNLVKTAAKPVSGGSPRTQPRWSQQRPWEAVRDQASMWGKHVNSDGVSRLGQLICLNLGECVYVSISISIPLHTISLRLWFDEWQLKGWNKPICRATTS